MAQSAVNPLQPVESVTAIPVVSNTGEQIPDDSIHGISHDSGAAAATSQSSRIFAERPPYFDEALNDAERLLKYAAEIGIDVDADTRDKILEARAAHETGCGEEIAANLLRALTKLATLLKPVTAQSLKSCSEHTVHTYWLVSVCLAIIIVPFSLASFLSTAISTAIRADITTANGLAVQLRAQLGPLEALVVP
jgi:hypothetical protein